jgi:hypothetical protein
MARTTTPATLSTTLHNIQTELLEKGAANVLAYLPPSSVYKYKRLRRLVPNLQGQSSSYTLVSTFGSRWTKGPSELEHLQGTSQEDAWIDFRYSPTAVCGDQPSFADHSSDGNIQRSACSKSYNYSGHNRFIQTTLVDCRCRRSRAYGSRTFCGRTESS